MLSQVSTKDSRKSIKSSVERSLNASGKRRKKNCTTCKSSMNDHNQLASFKGLFFIAGLSSTYALVVFIFMFLYENKDILMSESSMHEKLTAIIRNFDEDKNKKPAVLETMDDSHVQVEVVDDNQAHDEENITQAPPLSPRTSIDHQGASTFIS
ncbi:Extracellular ligand-binding receptor [Artemisia annua]|uniref:Extracellular ligand-binding receptor n=1 Tax=Artemisia annua TaxID=35608 RepID=A0A2U1L1R0_ARTAN|nr:Extracellular ligand-binding receptor [Artemisia annua]